MVLVPKNKIWQFIGEMEVQHYTFLSMDFNTGEWTPSPSNCYISGEMAPAI
jgi:hypothetical protein